MRRLLSLLVTLLPLALPALADEPAKPPTLTASGEGIAMAVPDIAVVTLGVVSNGRSALAALSANSSDMAAVIAIIKAAGVADKDIGTSGFNVSPVYPPEREQNADQPAKIVGYRVSNDVRVTIRDFAKAGAVLDKVVSAGANQVNGISFELSDRAGPADEALKAAVAEATRKAGLMADAANVKLVRLVTLTSEESRPVPYGAAPDGVRQGGGRPDHGRPAADHRQRHRRVRDRPEVGAPSDAGPLASHRLAPRCHLRHGRASSRPSTSFLPLRRNRDQHAELSARRDWRGVPDARPRGTVLATHPRGCRNASRASVRSHRARPHRVRPPSRRVVPPGRLGTAPRRGAYSPRRSRKRGAAMAVEIFWVSGSPFSWRVLLAAEVKGVAYDSRMLSFDKGDHKTPEYRKLNPRGRTPLLRDGDFVLTESVALMVYLDRIGSGPPLFGTTPRETARVFEALSEITCDFERVAYAFAEPILFGSASAGDAAPLIKGASKLRTELAHFEARLTAHDHLAGAALSAADLAAHTGVTLALRAAGKDMARDLDLQLLPLETHYPKLAAWMKRMEALPGYAKAYPPHWKP